MTKKIYIKFSDERNFENSIKTTILDNGNKKIVQKQPIFCEGVKHIKDMYEKTNLLRNAFPNIKIGNIEIVGESLQYDYILGDSLADYYNRCIKSGKKEELLDLILLHAKIVKGQKDNQCEFYESDKSKNIFGDMSCFVGQKALKITNFEATAPNIYFKDNDIYFSDCEWVFDFPIPLDLVIYHCVIWTTFSNIPLLNELITMDELTEYLHIDRRIYDSYMSYLRNINSDKESGAYYIFKANYKKSVYSIHEIDKMWSKKLEQQQDYINQMEDGSKRQQQYVSNLEEALKSQNKYVKRIEQEKKNQQAYISNLEEVIEAQKRYAENMENEKKGQQTYISNLEETIEAQKRYAENMENEKKGQQAYIANLEETIEAQKRYAENMENEKEGQQAYIANLEEAIESQKRCAENMENEKKGQQAYIANLEEAIEFQSKHVETIEQEKKNQQAYISNLEEELKVQNEYVHNLEKKIRAYIDNR